MNDKIKAFEEECHVVGALISGRDSDESVVAAVVTKDLARTIKPDLEACDTFDDDLCAILDNVSDYDDMVETNAALTGVTDLIASLPCLKGVNILDKVVVVSACAKNDKSRIASFDYTNPIIRCTKLAFPTPAELIAYMDDDESRERHIEQYKQL